MPGSVGVVPDVLHDVLEAQPGLRGGGDDLVGRQQEPVPSGVPQLEGVGVLDAHIVGPVDTAAAGLVWEGNVIYFVFLLLFV